MNNCVVSTAMQDTHQGTAQDIQALIDALESRGKSDTTWKVHRHTSRFFVSRKCPKCGERVVTPLSCDHALCPRCRRRLIQRHANELRKFGRGHPNLGVIGVARPFNPLGFKKRVHSCLREYRGAHRVDVVPVLGGWEDRVVIAGVPDDDVGLIRERL